MLNNNDFQSINENNNTFQSIDNNSFNNLEEEPVVDDSINTFIMGLPDWDLEPLYESIKRSGKE